MPDQILITRFEVERLASISRAAIYAQMSAGTFPRPVKIGPQAVRWRKDEVLTWIETRPRTGQAA